MQNELNTLGKHLIVDLYSCNSKKINNLSYIRKILLKSVEIGNMHHIKNFFHKFKEQGVSGVIIIAESHLSIHTWPEYNYCAIDIFACGKNVNLTAALNYIIINLECKYYNLNELIRGNLNIIGAENEFIN